MAELTPLTAAQHLPAERVGSKAATLAYLQRSGFDVPQGWVLEAAAHVRMHTADYSTDALPDLRPAFESLIRHSASGRLIVRSSGLSEDGSEHAFPGIFQSVYDISTYGDLQRAVVSCMKASHSAAVREYGNAHGLPTSALHIGVLIQDQLNPILAGVAFTRSPLPDADSSQSILIEMTRGQNAAVTKKGEISGAFHATRQGRRWNVNPIFATADLEGDDVERVAEEVARVASRIETLFDKPRDVEWAWCDGRVWVLQARPVVAAHRQASLSYLRPIEARAVRRSEILPRETEVGLKGAAMMLFAEIGLFRLPIRFLEPHSSLHRFNDDLKRTDFGDAGVTVRFSYRDELGLPRFLVSSKADVPALLRRVWKPEWLAIVHSCIEATRSFELYIAADHWVLEHVPGLWESDNRSSPDVVIDKAGTLQVIRHRGQRHITLLTAAGRRVEVAEPEPVDTIVQWAADLRPVAEQLRRRLRLALPLNLHFVTDKGGGWHFLNIRRTHTITADFLQRGEFHVVDEVSDLDSWDGRQSILIAATVARGEEATIVRLASELRQRTRTVYVAFGILSHPAIVLRELGIETIPAYASHDVYQFAGDTP